jgi:hypothetical protein
MPSRHEAVNSAFVGAALSAAEPLYSRNARSSMNETRRTLPSDVLARPVQGRRLKGRTLGEEIGEEPTLVAFLRHFG